jgi:DNA-directed RNA polymerase specialized sigma subunit
MRAIAALPEQYQEIIGLYYWEGYTYPEIATITGRNRDALFHLAVIIHNQIRRSLCFAPDLSSPSFRSSYWQPPV